MSISEEDVDFSDLPDLELADGSEEDFAGVLAGFARILALNQLMAPRGGLFHSSCGICEQYERATIDYVTLCVESPGSSTQDSSGVLAVAHGIWLEHLVDGYRDFSRERQRTLDVIERSMDESKPPPISATEEEVASLGTEVYVVNEVEESCVVCLNELKPGDITTKTACSHLFHHDCVGRWLKMNVKCPVCRRNSITGENTAES